MLVDAGADIGACFYTMCMAVGEVEGLNEEVVVDLINSFKAKKLDADTKRSKQRQLPMDKKLFIKVNFIPLFEYIRSQ